MYQRKQFFLTIFLLSPMSYSIASQQQKSVKSKTGVIFVKNRLTEQPSYGNPREIQKADYGKLLRKFRAEKLG